MAKRYHPGETVDRGRNERRTPSLFRFITTFWLTVLAAFLFIRLLVELVRRWRAHKPPQPPAPAYPHEIELESYAPPFPVAPPPPVVVAPPPPFVVAPPEVIFDAPAETLAELLEAEEVSFEVSIAPPEEAEVTFEVAVEVAPSIPDLHLTVPPDVVLQSFEPKYQFNWQNPELLTSIYPFRKDKLIDFLAFYEEVDLVQEYQKLSVTDPKISAQIAKATTEMNKARQEAEVQLQGMIAARKISDPYFAKITGQNEKNLYFKYSYYLDREIDRLEDKLELIEDRKEALLKRVNWYEAGNPSQQLWRNRAAELDPEIQQVRSELEPVKTFRSLFDRLANLPPVNAQAGTKEAAMRWIMREKRMGWEKLTLDQLVEEIIKRIIADHNRYPEWLVYMVFHFSGMRYVSSHGSWADPRILLEALEREDEEERIDDLKPPELANECLQAVTTLTRLIKPGVVTPEQKSIGNMLTRLKSAGVQKRALIELSTEKILNEIKKLPDDQACLNRLVEYKVKKDSSGDPMPEWVWAEIVKYTPLRLNTTDPDWEAYSPERWKYQSRRWTDILNDWEQKDITSWRAKHHDTLELVVTRSVCNEIAEHIQHLRGNTPAAGLTSKPSWYMRQAEKDPDNCYFIQAPGEEDFRVGASILWLEWMTQKPSPWQMARPLRGFSLYPGEGFYQKPGMRGEVRAKDLAEPGWGIKDGWVNKPFSEFYIRTRRKPTKQELKSRGKSDAEIQKITAEYVKTGQEEVEYLRWRHEATVVDVVDMIDGKYVLTFETGKIGIIMRRLNDLRGNPMIFVGFVPERPLTPEMDARLVNMLKWERILPTKAFPTRPRPVKIFEKPKPKTPAVIVQQPGPQKEMLVIRDQIRCYSFKLKDNLGRPKFQGALPPVQLTLGMRVLVSATQKESSNDRGDGVINTQDGSQYLKITGIPAGQPNPPDQKAIGLYVKLHAPDEPNDLVDYTVSKWIKVNPKIPKTNAQILKGYDDNTKPYFEPREKESRLSIKGGSRIRVSTIHKECFVDKGDGIINSSGLVHLYYLILECPDAPGVAGLFVKIAETLPE